MLRVNDIGTPLNDTIDYLGNPLFGYVTATGRSIIHLYITSTLAVDVVACRSVIQKVASSIQTGSIAFGNIISSRLATTYKQDSVVCGNVIDSRAATVNKVDSVVIGNVLSSPYATVYKTDIASLGEAIHKDINVVNAMVDSVLIGGTLLRTNILRPLSDVLCVRKAIEFEDDSAIPHMYSDTSPGGYVSSASEVYNSTYAAWHAFDGAITNDNAWMTTSGVITGWLKIQLTSSAVAIQKYTIWDRRYDINQDAGGAAYAPRDWQFQGSHDGSSWVTLDAHADITWSVSAQEAKTYYFINLIEYKYYRLNVLENGGGTRIAIGELEIFEEHTDKPLYVQALTRLSDVVQLPGSITPGVRAIRAECITLAGSVLGTITQILTEIVRVSNVVQYGFRYIERVNVGQAFSVSATSRISNRITLGGGIHVNPYKEFSEAIRFSGSFTTRVSKSLVEVISLTNVLIRYVTKRMTAELMRIYGTLTPTPLAYKRESIRVNESRKVLLTRRLLDGITLTQTVLNNVRKLMVLEIVMFIQRPTRGVENIIDNGRVAITTKLTETGDTIARLNTSVGSRVMLSAMSKYGVEVIAIVNRTREVAYFSNVLKKYPQPKILNVVQINEARSTRVTARLTDQIYILGTRVTQFSKYILNTISLTPLMKSTPITVRMALETINLVQNISWVIRGLFNEVLSLSPSMGRVTATSIRSDIIRIAKDFPPLDPFHSGRIPVIITYNSIPNQVLYITNVLLKCPYLIKAESIYILYILTHPFIKTLTEVIYTLGSIPTRILSIKKLESIILSDTWTLHLRRTLPGEILNVILPGNSSAIRVNLIEYLRIRAAFHPHLSFIKVEVLYLLSPVSYKGIVAKRTAEVINVIDTRSVRLSKILSEQIKIMREVFTKGVLSYHAEAITIIDDVYSQFGAVLLEMIYFADSMIKRPAPYLAERLIIYDDVYSTLGMVLTEVFAIGDSLIKSPRKVFLEVLNAEQRLSTTVLTSFKETIKLFQTTIKRPMKYQTTESIVVSDARSVSVLSAMISEVLTVNDTLRRLISVPLIEKVKLTDVQCAKIVSFVAHEILALIGSEYATLNRTLSEVILLPDSKHISVLVERLEALLVATRIARVVSYSAFMEVISLTQSITPRVLKRFNESIIIGMGLTKSVSQVKLELITLGQRFNKILHARYLTLETITLADSRTWFNNLVHRIESVVRQVTKNQSSERSTKERVVKKTTKDSKRE